MKVIYEYQAVWSSRQNHGYFYFTYYNGERKRTETVNAESFSIMIDILRNEKPVYGNHINPSVSTAGEPVGEGE